MQINNISNCHKPKSFTGLKDTGKVRYKHYEQMSDGALSAFSIAKAYKDVKSSSKSKFSEALPIVTSVLTATSIALTQPGKLSSKVNSGVGFLALLTGVNLLSEGISKLAYKGFSKKTDKNDATKNAQNKLKAYILGSSAALAAAVGTVVAIAKNKNAISNSSSKAVQFLKGEGEKLVSELNNSKLGKKIEEKFNPFMARHGKTFNVLKHTAPFGVILGGSFADSALRKSLSDDIAKKTMQNYIKGKAAQQDARAHFDSIDAIEV